MFVTTEEVEKFTGVTAGEISEEDVAIAQTLIESYVGRIEPEVINAVDRMLLGRATAYQVVYMAADLDRTFKQVAAQQIMQFGNMITFKQGDAVAPFIAPLAAMTCQGLSWKRIRSIKTGSIFAQPVKPTEWSRD